MDRPSLEPRTPDSDSSGQAGEIQPEAIVDELSGRTASRLRATITLRSICTRIRALIVVSAVLLVVIYLAVSYVELGVRPRDAGGNLSQPLAVACLLLVTAGAGAYAGLGAVSRKCATFVTHCAMRLRSCNEISDLPALLLFRNTQASEVDNALVEQLICILDRIDAGDDAGVSGAEWRKLLVNIERDWIIDASPLGVALIRMFERTGNTSSIDTVRRYARPGAWLLAGETVRAAARESLPGLQAALHEQRQRDTLLRASGAGAAQQDSLLRAAETGKSITAPKLLLRPSGHGNQTDDSG